MSGNADADNVWKENLVMFVLVTFTVWKVTLLKKAAFKN